MNEEIFSHQNICIFSFQKIQNRFTSYSKTFEQKNKSCIFGFKLGHNHYSTPTANVLDIMLGISI